MNYLLEIRAFHELIEVKRLSTGQIALWYALMAINNKCAWIEWFTASSMTLEIRTGLSESGVLKARNALKLAGLIDFKSGSPRKAALYRMIPITEEDDTADVAFCPPNPPNSTGVSEGVSEGVSTGISEGIGKGISEGISTALNKLNKTETKKENEKKKYGEFQNVLLSDEELDRLRGRFADWQERIERLSGYVAASGRCYKSHYAAILNWARRDGAEEAAQPSAEDIYGKL